jgi:hypothetical protein
LLFLAASLSSYGQSTFARQGVLDLSGYDFQQGPVRLQGECEFFMSELLLPDQIHDSNVAIDYINFPGTWNELSKSRRPGEGFATYHLKIVLSGPSRLALEIPQIYSNYSLWANGKLVAQNGVVAKTPEASVPQWRPQTVAFAVDGKTLDIVLQISNFHHDKGGIREDIWLGTEDQLHSKRSIAVASNLFLMVSLVILAIGFLIVFSVIRNDREALLFAALCLTWALRSGYSNLYVMNFFFPDFPWTIGVKIEYITLYLTMIWAVLLVNEVFPDDGSQIFKYLFVSCNAIFTVVTIGATPALFTQFLPVYLSFAGILLLYIIYVLLHAIIYERRGVWLIVSCFMVGVIIFAYDIISYQTLTHFNAVLINSGYIIMFLLMATGIALKLGWIKKNVHAGDMLTFDDLYGGK